MKVINLTRKRPAEELEALYRKCPKNNDCSEVISESALLYFEGELKAIYISDFQDGESLRHLVRKVKFQKSRRNTGVPSISRVFGFQPRDPLRKKDFCSGCALRREQPEVHDALVSFAKKLDEVYCNLGADKYKNQIETIWEKVLPEYRMANTVYTSGIVNFNNPLQYHYDAGNFKNCWSAMIVFKEQTLGGNLNLPEYDVQIETGDRSLLLFDGQSELHGVTPIVREKPEGYRYSIVYYALEKMKHCLAYAEELKRAQRVRTETEMRRAGLIK